MHLAHWLRRAVQNKLCSGRNAHLTPSEGRTLSMPYLGRFHFLITRRPNQIPAFDCERRGIATFFAGRRDMPLRERRPLISCFNVPLPNPRFFGQISNLASWL